MTQKERMLAGLPYKAWMDGLPEERARAQRACWEFNRLPPDARAERTALLRGLFGRTGEHLHIEEPFHCDLGYNIEVGEWFYANYNCVILDVCRVTIGDNVMFAPNVAIYAAGHPVHPAARNSGYEYGQPVAIGNNVWLGGNTVVTPGVTIGDNVWWVRAASSPGTSRQMLLRRATPAACCAPSPKRTRIIILKTGNSTWIGAPSFDALRAAIRPGAVRKAARLRALSRDAPGRRA